MIGLIYSLLFYLAMVVVFPFVGMKALIDARYRYRLSDRLGFSPKCGDRPVIWCHTASVGEVLLALPFFKHIQSLLPDYDLFVSTQTPSGHQTVDEKLGSYVTSFLTPLDSFDAVRRSVQRVRPDIYIVFETELWPNLLLTLHDRKVPVVLMNGRISETSISKYRFFRFVMCPVLRSFTCLCMQSRSDADRIIRLGAAADTVLVTGNLKYDRTLPPCPDGLKSIVDTWLTENETKSLIVLGSLHEEEFHMLLDVIISLKSKTPDIRFIIAPRHLENISQLEEMARERGLNMFKRSRADVDPVREKQYDAMILDTYGELSSIYSLATIVFVGGSLSPHGGQNMLEPAYFKKPVLFGPHIWNFRDISAHLLDAGAAMMVKDSSDLAGQILFLLNNHERCQVMGDNGFQVISHHQGALDKAMTVLSGILTEKGSFLS